MKTRATLRMPTGPTALNHAASKQIPISSHFRRITLSVVFTSGIASGFLSASAANYVITDLGTLGGDCNRATDVNSLGQVVGVARTADGRDHAFRWQNGLMTDLGALGGTNSHAAAINETGEIVGWAETPEGQVRACLFGGGTNVDLSGGHADNSYAADINDQGRVVGWTETPVAGADQPWPTAVIFRTNSPKVQYLIAWEDGTLRGRATAINNDNLIGGWTSAAFWVWSFNDRATRWQGLSSFTSTRYGDFDSYVRGMDEAGQMVGESDLLYVSKRAALWSGTNQLSLGSLALGSSTAAAINHAGQIVGSSAAYRFGLITNNFPIIVFPGSDTNGPPPPPQVYEGYQPTRHAFLWQDGVMSDLNDLIPTNSGWELTEAASINDAGQIVGAGNFTGQTRAFLLTPVLNPNQIPFVRMLSPTDGEWVSGTSIALHVEANDMDGQIRMVEFFAQRVTKRDLLTGGFLINYLSSAIGGQHPPGYLGTATNAPFALNVTDLAAGNYLILTKATDDQGTTACAAEVLLRVNAPPRLSLVRGQIPFPSPPPPPDNTLTLRLVNGNEEKIYDIETSSDLSNWTNVGFINPSPHSFLNNFFRISEPADSQRFYRAVAR